MLPELDDFPGYRDSAARVLEQTRLELVAREEPLSGMEELKLFRLRAGEVLLPLPVKYAEIIAWGNDIDRLIDWTDSIDQQLSTLPALVVHVRKIVRSERFECAKSEDQATIVLAWARIEDKFGETEKAIAALKWGLAELNNQPRRESTEVFTACMGGLLRRLQRKLEAQRGLQGSAEPEAARGSDVAVDWEPAEPRAFACSLPHAIER